MKKHLLTATALGAIAALSLTACSSGDDDTTASEASSSADPTATASASETGLSQFGADADVEVLKGLGWTDSDGQPTLDFDEAVTVSDSASYVTAPGDGDIVAAGDDVTLDVVAVSGADGSVLASTYESGTPDTIPMVEGALPPALYNVIVGNAVGMSMVFAELDMTATVEDGADAPSVVYAVSVDSIVQPPEVADDAAALPSVTFGDDGAPAIDFADAELPEGIVAKVLTEGDGAEVAVDQTITADYTGWVWDGDKFDSSWDKGEAMNIPLANLVKGWQYGLEGQKVGSKVLLVIPSEYGYGDQEAGAIPAGSTLVFVVDILDAE